jgi:hypothetical protein
LVDEEEMAGMVTMWMRSEERVLLTNGVPDLWRHRSNFAALFGSKVQRWGWVILSV